MSAITGRTAALMRLDKGLEWAGRVAGFAYIWLDAAPHPMAAVCPKPPLAEVLNAAQQRHQTGHSRTTQHLWLSKTALSKPCQCRI